MYKTCASFHAFRHRDKALKRLVRSCRGMRTNPGHEPDNYACAVQLPDSVLLYNLTLTAFCFPTPHQPRSFSQVPTWGQSFSCAALLTERPTWPLGKTRFCLSLLPTSSIRDRLDCGWTTRSYSPMMLGTGQVMFFRLTVRPPTCRRPKARRFC